MSRNPAFPWQTFSSSAGPSIERPDAFDVTRLPERQLYFGYGQHFCIGKSLARLEAQVALEEIGQRFPNYEVIEKGLVRTHQSHVRGFAHVPIRY